MAEIELFVGFKPDSNFIHSLEETNPYLLTLFTSGGDYLQKITYHSQEYWGKFALQPATWLHLQNLNENVSSLLRRLVPEKKDFSQHLVLLAITNICYGK